MKCKTLQVVWHSKEPVYSVDFHPNGQLVTGGADKEVKVWEVERAEDGYANVRHVSSLAAHLSTVNCVRFSPTGAQLASSGDGGEVLLWEPVDTAAAAAKRGNLCEDEGDATWRRSAAFKGHAGQSDVMDLRWAPDGSALATCAIDSEVILWAAEGKRRGSHATRLKNHKHFVQGLAWDPAQQYVITQSADRTCKVYALKPPAAGGRKSRVSQYLLPAYDTAKDLYQAHTLSKRTLAGEQAGEGGKPATHPLFADERVNTFFRRPDWSPDGSLLVLPAGVFKASAEAKELHTAYVYARGVWSSPIMHLPGHTKPVVAVRFCPVLFERGDGREAQAQQAQGQAQQEGGADAVPVHPFDLPYKMVFAVATLDSVVLYDTLSPLPLAVLGHLHYDSITDLAWSSDGQYLAVSSRDCYCSIAAFDAGELGKLVPADKLPAHIAKRMAAAQRRAEPLKQPAPKAAATPSAARAAAPAGTPSAAGAGASAPAAPVPVPAAAGLGSALPAEPAAAQPVAAVPAAAAPASVRKRIHPQAVCGPAGASPGQAAFGAGGAAPSAAGTGAEAAAGEGQGAAKKARRVVPDMVGPAPAVVGDSQQEADEPCRLPEPPAPAGAKPQRRIAPQPVGGPSGAPLASAAVGTGAGAGAAGAKPVRRIVAEPVGPMPAPPSAAKSTAPAESAASGKKRITPTPLVAASAAVSQQFGGQQHAQQQVTQPAPSEMSHDGGPAPSARRITPIPVEAPRALPQGEERTATAAPRTGIAAMAAAMGAQAAQARKE